MRKPHLLAATALAVAASLGSIATAGAAPEPREPQASVLGNIKTNDDGTASVKAQYVCHSGFHLWVSAKQSESGEQDEALEGEGSSQIAAAWLQDHPSEFTCNGKPQTDRFEINTEPEPEFGVEGFGELKRGWAWVQFCLIGENGEFISESRWVKVR